jgi:hypothetical protein
LQTRVRAITPCRAIVRSAERRDVHSSGRSAPHTLQPPAAPLALAVFFAARLRHGCPATAPSSCSSVCGSHPGLPEACGCQCLRCRHTSLSTDTASAR